MGEVGQVKQVVLDGRPAVLPSHDLPILRRRSARPDARLTVDVEKAVRAVTAQAIKPAAAVVLERARERPNPRAIEARCNRVALPHRD